MSTFGEAADELLGLGGPLEEGLEFLRGPFETDEWRRAMLAQQLQTNYLLAQIASNTGELPEELEGIIVPRQQPPRDDDDDTDQGGYEPPEEPLYPDPGPTEDFLYWVTEDTIRVNNTNYHTVSWGFPAKSLVLLFDNRIEVAFEEPGADANRETDLRTNLSPFTISPDGGFGAINMWYRQHPDASGAADLDIIAIGEP